MNTPVWTRIRYSEERPTGYQGIADVPDEPIERGPSEPRFDELPFDEGSKVLGHATVRDFTSASGTPEDPTPDGILHAPIEALVGLRESRVYGRFPCTGGTGQCNMTHLFRES